MDYPVNMQSVPEVTAFLEEETGTICYLVRDPSSKHCAIIDSVLNFNFFTGRTSYEHADSVIAAVEAEGLTLDWIIETHVHADHLSAAPYIQSKLGGKIGIGDHIQTVQETFGIFYNEGSEFQRDGSQFDQLFKDGDTYQIGNMQGFAIYAPGHTPACMAHVIGNATFTGDTLFMPDSGSARTDFPGGDSGALYDSIQKILAMPDDMRLFMCHDYGGEGRGVAWETTVAEQKAKNVDFGGDTTREEFIALRDKLNAGLAAPRLIIPSLQVNMRAGHLPEDKDGNLMLKVPVNKL